MFDYLKGVLSEKNPLFAVVDCNGVAYKVSISLQAFEKLPKVGSVVQLFIHTSFSDKDGFRLYGFITKADRGMFELLISASKIGPKTAVSILSKFDSNILAKAISEANVALLSTIPGVGKKSAERLIVELKDKVGLEDVLASSPSNGGADINREAANALVALGYRPALVATAMNALEGEFKTTEELIKATIQKLFSPKK